MSNANLCQNILRVFLQGIARGILDVLQTVVSKLFSLLRNSFRLYPWSHISLISLDAASTKYSLLVQRYGKRHSWLCRTAYLQLVETVLSIWGNFLYEARAGILSRLSYILTSQIPGDNCIICISRKWTLGPCWSWTIEIGEGRTLPSKPSSQ